MPPIDPMVAALAISVCDLLAIERAKLWAVLSLLESKGIFSSSEVTQEIQASTDIPPDEVEAISQELQTQLRAAMTKHYQRMVLEMMEPGSAPQ